MVETRPHGEEPGAAGWDGIERRRTAAPHRRSEKSPWRSPERMRGQFLVGITVVFFGLAAPKAWEVLGAVSGHVHALLH